VSFVVQVGWGWNITRSASWTRRAGVLVAAIWPAVELRSVGLLNTVRLAIHGIAKFTGDAVA
jgi:hypothetical protein